MKKKSLSFLAAVILSMSITGCNMSNPQPGPGPDPVDPPVDPVDAELAQCKSDATDKLDEIVLPVIAKIQDEELRNAVQGFYDSEKAYIVSITDLETARQAVAKVVDDTKAFVVNTLRPLAISKIRAAIVPLIEALPDEGLKSAVLTFFNTEMDKIAEIDDLDQVANLFKSIVEDTKAFIKAETARVLVALKNAAIEELDAYVLALIEKIPFEALETETRNFYNTEKEKVVAVETIEGLKELVPEIKKDLMDYAIRASIRTATSELDKYLSTLIAKIPNDDIKSDVNALYAETKDRLNAVEKLEDIVPTMNDIKESLKTFAFTESKKVIIAELDKYISALIEKIPHEQVKTDTQSFYTAQKAKLNAVEELDNLLPTLNSIKEDLYKFALQETKKVAFAEVDKYVNEYIEKIPNEQLKKDTQSFYATERAKIDAVTTLEGILPCIKEIKDDIVEFAITEIRTIAVAELDKYVGALIDKVPNDTIKADLRAFYEQEKALINKVENVEDVPACVEQIKKDLSAFAVSETKKVALQQLDEVVAKGLAKLANEELKTQLNTYYKTEKAKIEAAETLEDLATVTASVLKETATYIKDLVLGKLADYIDDLFNFEAVSTFDYLPDAMKPSYTSNFVASPVSDYTTGVNVSSFNREGYGEQWQMIVENLNQVDNSVKALNFVETGISTVANAFKIYIDNTTNTEIDYSYTSETVNGKIGFENDVLTLEVTFNKGATIPVFGTIQPIIKITNDIVNKSKTVFIKLNDNNVVKYNQSSEELELGITYGISGGSRTTYFKGTASSGELYEYTTLAGKDAIKACANYYIQNGYVTVVGNKASGMIAYKGYINELYKANEGKLLGYKVQEDLSVAGVTSTYHTLWFNMWDISGINKVKVVEKTDANTSSKSTVDTYLNDSTSLLVPTYNKQAIIGKTSRKYDVELRNRYFYSIVDEKLTSQEVQVPMMMIQDDHDKYTNYSDFVNDFKTDNGFDASVSMNSAVLAKIRYDYETYIPTFKTNLEKMTSAAIIEYLNA